MPFLPKSDATSILESVYLTRICFSGYVLMLLVIFVYNNLILRYDAYIGLNI